MDMLKSSLIVGLLLGKCWPIDARQFAPLGLVHADDPYVPEPDPDRQPCSCTGDAGIVGTGETRGKRVYEVPVAALFAEDRDTDCPDAGGADGFG